MTDDDRDPFLVSVFERAGGALDGVPTIALGQVQLPAQVILAAVECPDLGMQLSAVPGAHDVIGLPSGGNVFAILVRRPGPIVATWRMTTVDIDEHVALGAPDAFARIEWEQRPLTGETARDWTRIGDSFVWVSDPQGLGETIAYVGVDADERLAAVLIAV